MNQTMFLSKLLLAQKNQQDDQVLDLLNLGSTFDGRSLTTNPSVNPSPMLTQLQKTMKLSHNTIQGARPQQQNFEKNSPPIMGHLPISKFGDKLGKRPSMVSEGEANHVCEFNFQKLTTA